MTNLSKEIKNEEVLENEVLVTEDLVTEISTSMFENTTQAIFSSIQGTDRATNIKVYNAINASENSLSDFVGDVLEITDMVAHPIEIDDTQTGEKIKAMRVVLLTADGVGYHSVSGGVVSSLQKLIGIVGQAPWTPALQVVPVKVKTRKNFETITLKLQG